MRSEIVVAIFRTFTLLHKLEILKIFNKRMFYCKVAWYMSLKKYFVLLTMYKNLFTKLRILKIHKKCILL